VDRVLGELRVRDVALHAVHREPAAEAAAAPDLDVSPKSCSLDGSPTRHQSMRSLRAFRSTTTRRVPSTDGPSSSLVIRNAIEPRCAGCRATNSSQAVTIAASPLFMSAAPRPYSRPSRIDRLERVGMPVLERPGGHDVGVAGEAEGRRVLVPPRVAQKLSTLPYRSRSTANPSCSSRAIITSWQPPSTGLTDWRAIRSCVNSSVALIEVGNSRRDAKKWAFIRRVRGRGKRFGGGPPGLPASGRRAAQRNAEKLAGAYTCDQPAGR
jgi:hypothetical protein